MCVRRSSADQSCWRVELCVCMSGCWHERSDRTAEWECGRANACASPDGSVDERATEPHGASRFPCHAAAVTETPSLPATRNGESVPPVQDRAVDLAEMAEMALSVLEEATLPQTVERVLEFARAAVGCGHAAVVFVHSKRRLETVAVTDPAIEDLIAKQAELQEGPVLSVLDDGHSVVVDDTRTETRWPGWASTAAAMGFRSTLAVPLFTSDRTLGTLNLYDAHADHFSTADLQVAQLLARHAAIAVSRVQTEDNLWRAVDSRKLIGQAQGILMERYALNADHAFEVLRRYSQHSNVKLRAVAQMVVDTRRLPDTSK
jgi:transcriptional regulator with GAF, ATPase, and Fis domain